MDENIKSCPIETEVAAKWNIEELTFTQSYFALCSEGFGFVMRSRQIADAKTKWSEFRREDIPCTETSVTRCPCRRDCSTYIRSYVRLWTDGQHTTTSTSLMKRFRS